MAFDKVVLSLQGRNFRDMVGAPNKDMAAAEPSAGHLRSGKGEKLGAPKARSQSCLAASGVGLTHGRGSRHAC